MSLELEGKTAIVTGAARGIGKNIARTLVTAGDAELLRPYRLQGRAQLGDDFWSGRYLSVLIFLHRCYL